MSTIRLSGTSSGYYDLTVPAAAGTNSIDLSNLPVKDSNGNLSVIGDIIRNDTTTGIMKFALQYNGADAAVFRRNNTTGVATISNGYAGAAVDSLNIDLAGRITTPNQPSFLMKKYSGGSNAIAVNSVWTYDEALSNVGAHANISNGRFTAPVAGSYCFMWHNIGEGTSTVYRSFIRKNGSNTWGTGSYRLESRNYHSAGYPNASAQVVVQLNASDYVDIYLEGGNIYSDTTNGVWFCGFLIG